MSSLLFPPRFHLFPSSLLLAFIIYFHFVFQLFFVKGVHSSSHVIKENEFSHYQKLSNANSSSANGVITRSFLLWGKQTYLCTSSIRSHTHFQLVIYKNNIYLCKCDFLCDFDSYTCTRGAVHILLTSMKAGQVTGDCLRSTFLCVLMSPFLAF